MKKTLMLALATLCVGSTWAQENPKDQRKAQLEEVLEEKLRWPLEELEAYYYAQRQEKTPAANGNQATWAGKTQQLVQEIKVSTLTGSNVDEGEAFIAINPKDSNNLVLSYMELGTTSSLSFPIYYSTDAGATWVKSSFDPASVFANDFPTQTIGGGGDPVFAFDENGKLYFSWIYLGIDFPNDIASFTLNWAYSLDGGASFQVAPDSAHFIGAGALEDLQFGGSISNKGDGVFDRQWMSVDLSSGPHAGRLYVSSLFVPNDSTSLRGIGTVVRVKEVGNSTFERQNFALATHPNTQFGNVVVDNQGTAHITYIDLLSNQLMYARMASSDTSFSTPVGIQSTTSLFPNTAPFHSRSNGAPNLVADQGDNALYLVYSDFIGQGKVNSFFMRSLDGGNSWSAPLDISTFTTGRASLMPTVAAVNGRVSLSWYDIDSNRNALHYSVQSLNQGSTWLTPRQLSADTTTFGGFMYNSWFGDYNNSVRTNCYTYSLYADGRDGQSTKMYVAKVNNCQEIGLAEISPLTHKISLEDVFPNPAVNELHVVISSLERSDVALRLRTITGQEAAALYEGTLQPGDNRLKVNLPKGIGPGTYILDIQTSLGNFQRKLLIKQ